MSDLTSTLPRRIIATLAYFDIFDYPLTAEELRQWLWQGSDISHADFLSHLEVLVGSGQIERRDSYYALAGHLDLTLHRGTMVRYVEEKIQIVRRAARKLLVIPFIRAIFVANRVGAGYPAETSDIDILVVAKSGRLWIVRLFTLLILDLYRLRPRPGQSANKVCPCFFLADDHMDLASIRLSEPDIYLVYWTRQLVPIYDPEGLYVQIARANSWVQTYLPNHREQDYTLAPRWQIRARGWQHLLRTFFVRAWSGRYGDLIERQARTIQLPRIEAAHGAVSALPDSRVIISDHMLKFHKNDRRDQYREAWQARCRQYLGPEYV